MMNISKKGQSPPQMFFIFISVTLIFIVFFAVNPLQVAIEETIQSTAQLQARRTVSAINIALSAPDGSTFSVEMPNAKCSVTITQHFVTMKIKLAGSQENTQTLGIIKTPAKIIGGDFDCQKKFLTLSKKGDVLEIT